MKVSQRTPVVRGDGYHPGNVTTDNGGFKHDEPPAMSERIVTDRVRPVLYDADERPIYRKVGFTS